MCGIFGWTINEKQARKALPLAKREALVVALARANVSRGRHSWGAYAAMAEGAEVMKGVGPMTSLPGLSSLALASTLMAHTRHATTGDVTEVNSHPFQIGVVLGAHNGMIYNHADLNRQYGRACTVDSQHLFHHINEGRPLTDCEGYGTVEYVRTDADAATVYLCQMEGGELAAVGLGSRKNPYAVVWSSSEAHLAQALREAGIKGAFPYALKRNRVYAAKPDGVLYRSNTEHRLAQGGRRVSLADLAKTRGEVETRRPSIRLGRPLPGGLRRPETTVQGFRRDDRKEDGGRPYGATMKPGQCGPERFDFDGEEDMALYDEELDAMMERTTAWVRQGGLPN